MSLLLTWKEVKMTFALSLAVLILDDVYGLNSTVYISSFWETMRFWLYFLSSNGLKSLLLGVSQGIVIIGAVISMQLFAEQNAFKFVISA